MGAPDAVEVLERNIEERPDVDFFHSARRYIDDHGEPISDVLPRGTTFTSRPSSTRVPVKHLLCWRRELALAIGGIDESLNSVGPDDYDFPWSMMEAGARFGAIQECLYVYRDHRSVLPAHDPPAAPHARARDAAHPAQARGAPCRDPAAPASRPREPTSGSASTRRRLDAWLKRALRRRSRPRVAGEPSLSGLVTEGRRGRELALAGLG